MLRRRALVALALPVPMLAFLVEPFVGLFKVVVLVLLPDARDSSSEMSLKSLKKGSTRQLFKVTSKLGASKGSCQTIPLALRALAGENA